ncbi:transcriptional repressor [candidate division CSSED10-310 bacterium]|uniref:Transcriptional repressor n=1 Tax=candidate division CSSED10-310 bacterium TaxID=2855610 RepID=A0ABV6YSU3_UNCC1
MLNNHSEIKRQFLSLLEQVGDDFDEKYMVVLEIFSGTDDHFSIAEIEKLTLQQGQKMSAAEIETILNTFVRYGIARILKTDDGKCRYEHLHINEHHDHLICTKCSKIIEMCSDELEHFQERVTLENNFYPLYHRLQIYGICSDCLGKRKPLLALSYTSTGERIKIEEISGGRGLVNRLNDMGLYKGVEAKVLNDTGNYILQIGEMRIAIGRGMANKIKVSPVLDKKIELR